MPQGSRKRAIDSDSDDMEDGDLEEEIMKSLGGEKNPSRSAKNKRSAWGDSDSDSESDGDEEWTAEGGSAASKKKGKDTGKGKKGKKRTRTLSSDEDWFSSDDDGEAPKLSDDNLSSESEEEFVDEYGDDLMGDAEDRRKLLQMSEMDREAILYKRGVERENKREIFAMKRQLKLAKKQQEKQKSRQQKKETRKGEVKESGRKDVRAKKTRKTTAIDELKARRKENEDKKKVQTSRKTRSAAAEAFESDDDKQETTWTPGQDEDKQTYADTSAGYDKEGDLEADIDDLDDIRLSRHRVEKWVHQPFFEDIVVGCLVKVVVHQNQYKVAEISEVYEGTKVYELTNNTKTSKLLRLKLGKDSKSFKISYLSNRPFEQQEVNSWKDVMAQAGVPLFTKKVCERKRADIKKGMNYKYSDEDILRIVAAKKRYREVKNFVTERTRLLREISLLQEKGDKRGAEKIMQQLAEIKIKSEKHNENRVKELGNIVDINRRNRYRNKTEDAVKNKEEADDEDEYDPFERRKCRPLLVQQEATSPRLDGEGNALKPVSPMKLKSSPSAKPKAGKFLGVPDLTNVAKIKKPGDELFEAHDFDLEIEVSLSKHVKPIASLSTKLSQKAVSTTPLLKTPMLSLSAYKKKRGLI
eukprot:Nk52_evm53s343 gene=Nk52_evmTU53s343